MRRLILLIGLLVNAALADGPYPTFSGLSAAPDDAVVAATKPAAITLFTERPNGRLVLL